MYMNNIITRENKIKYRPETENTFPQVQENLDNDTTFVSEEMP